MKRGRLVPLTFLPLCVATVAIPVLAQPPSGSSSSSTANPASDPAKAQVHFSKAQGFYNAGNYREAINELEVARKLDPKGSRLVLNLGIVHERIGKFDEALEYLRAYLKMDNLDPAEKNKAETMIKRIEGAKKDLPPTPPPTPSSTASTTAPPPSSTAPPPPPENGRVDSLTIGFGIGAGVGLAAGAGLGIYALTSRPTNFVTGRDGSFDELKDQTDSAHTMAIIADVALGVGIVASAITMYLYFGRTKEEAPAPKSTPASSAKPKTAFTIAPLTNGAAVGWGGRF